MEESLRDLLKHGRRFERMRTAEPGLFIRKIPQSKDEPAYLAVEISPVDKSGNPIGKIGVIIKDRLELEAVRAILSEKTVDEAFQAIERVSQHQIENEKDI